MDRKNNENREKKETILIRTIDRRFRYIFRCNCGLIRFPTNLFNHDRSRIVQRDEEGEIERRRDSLIESNVIYKTERIREQKHFPNYFYRNIFKICAREKIQFLFRGCAIYKINEGQGGGDEWKSKKRNR